MYCSNHRLYTQVKALARGEFELPPFHRRILEILERDFSIHALHFGLDVDSKIEFGQQFLEIVVARIKRAEELNQKADKAAIARAFIAELATNPDAPDARITQLFVSFHSVEETAALEASEIATPRSREFEHEIAKAFAYAGISHIDELAANHYVIWYKTEAQEDAGARNGTDALIRVEFLKRLRANDPQGWITEDALDLEFVSSERIDRDFGSGIAFYR